MAAVSYVAYSATRSLIYLASSSVFGKARFNSSLIGSRKCHLISDIVSRFSAPTSAPTAGSAADKTAGMAVVRSRMSAIVVRPMINH